MTTVHNAAIDYHAEVDSDSYSLSQDDNISTFTFYVSDSLFAIEIEYVLSVKEDINKIQAVPVGSKGVQGVYKYQDTIVPVYDFSALLNLTSGQQKMQDLIDNLQAREQDHVDWLNALEASIKNDVAFTKALDPHQCAFGKWYDSFVTRDETLSEILSQFDEPHQRIHSLANTLLNLKGQGHIEKALEQLKIERHTTLSRLRNLFASARNQVQSVMRPVILFITRDGAKPVFGMIVDEINNVIDYSRSQKQTGLTFNTNDTEFSNCMTGMYVKDEGPDSIVLDVEKAIALLAR